MHIHQTTLDLQDGETPVEVRVNRRAKRLILKVDAVRGRAIVTAPSKQAIPEALAFARARGTWISEQLEQRLRGRPFSPGAICPFRGVSHVIFNAGPPRAQVKVTPPPSEETYGEIVVGGDPSHVNRRIIDWLKRQAKTILTEKVDYYSDMVGRKRGTISVRDTRSRWGSCASDGALSFSWRLVLAPPWILDYVAAHECAHLVHLNHSPEYWRLLYSLNVEVDAARHWFNTHGETLHAYGVDAPIS